MDILWSDVDKITGMTTQFPFISSNGIINIRSAHSKVTRNHYHNDFGVLFLIIKFGVIYNLLCKCSSMLGKVILLCHLNL